jgi:hypothetical protein
MSAFEFFFSFYGLLLGLSVAVIATGVATAVQRRRTVRVGWLTPLLALFVALDIASFWDAAWTNFRHLPFSYGLLVAGLVIALVYFVAASLVFPQEIFPQQTGDAGSLDAHFWANKGIVLTLLIIANMLGGVAMLGANLGRENGMVLIIGYGFNMLLYLVLVGLAAWARRPALFAATLGLHVVIYVFTAGFSALMPHAVVDEAGAVALPVPVAPK